MFDVKQCYFICLFYFELLRQEDKCVLYSFMSTKIEVPLQSELTECLVNARHWLLCMGANLIGDMCWDLGSPSLAGKNMPITNSIWYVVCSVQFSCSVMSDFCNPMNYSTPGFAVLHQLLELGQTHVHRDGDSIQPSHLLSSSSPPAFNLSQ